MKHYICFDKVSWSDTELCECEYREVSPGNFEFRYQGEGRCNKEDREWKPIVASSVEEVESYGHRLVEVDHEGS